MWQGAAIDRIVFEILRNKYPNGSYTSNIQFDFVMCVGHFLSKVIMSTLTLSSKTSIMVELMQFFRYAVIVCFVFLVF